MLLLKHKIMIVFIKKHITTLIPIFASLILGYINKWEFLIGKAYCVGPEMEAPMKNPKPNSSYLHKLHKV